MAAAPPPTAFSWHAWHEKVSTRGVSTPEADGCITRLSPSAHPIWRDAVAHAASAFADASGLDARQRLERHRRRMERDGAGVDALDPSIHARAQPARTIATITDALIVRTGGGQCPSVLLPPAAAGSTGFIRGLHYLSGPAQRVRWWRPHPAYLGEDLVNATLRPGSLWLHHASLQFDARTSDGTSADSAESSSGSVWALFYVWFAHPPPTALAPPPSGRTRGSLHTMWQVPILSRADKPLRLAAAKLHEAATREKLPSLRGDTAASGSATYGGECSLPARAQPLRIPCDQACEGGKCDGDSESSIEASLRFVIETAKRETLLAGLSQLHVHRAIHWQLPPRATFPPQPAAAGVARAIIVLSPVTISAKSGRSRDERSAGRLRFQLLDPRPPGVRTSELSLAEWPFGVRNSHVSPLTPAGTVLVIPAGLRLASARLNSSKKSAHWIELHLGTDVRNGSTCAARQPRHTPSASPPPPESAKPPATATEESCLVAPAVTHLLHATAVTVRQRTDAESLEAVRAAAAVVREHARSTPSANVSNLGGWQSRADYLMEEPGVLTPLYPLVYDSILSHLATTASLPAKHDHAKLLSRLDVRLSGWANANDRGHSNALHEHVDQEWALSGVLYLDDGGDASCGLVFHSPLPPTTSEAEEPMSDRAHVAIAPPSAGMSIVFPSWLGHWVPPHCGDRTRLSIAFNAAVLLPERLWPDGGPAKPAPGLAKGVARAAKAELHNLWPLRLTVARAATSAALSGAVRAMLASSVASEAQQEGGCYASSILRCCVGFDEANECQPCEAAGEAASERTGQSAAMAPLLSPIGATVRSALTRNESSSTRRMEVHACMLAAGRALDSSLARLSIEALSPIETGRTVHAAGIFFLPPADVTDAACAESRALVLPDVRVAAGDLDSHLSFRRALSAATAEQAKYVASHGSITAPDSSVFVFPPWARAFAHHRAPHCEGDAQHALYFRAAGY